MNQAHEFNGPGYNVIDLDAINPEPVLQPKPKPEPKSDPYADFHWDNQHVSEQAREDL